MLLIASPDFFKLTISIIPDFVEQNGPLLLTDTELEINNIKSIVSVFRLISLVTWWSNCRSATQFNGNSCICRGYTDAVTLPRIQQIVFSKVSLIAYNLIWLLANLLSFLQETFQSCHIVFWDGGWESQEALYSRQDWRRTVDKNLFVTILSLIKLFRQNNFTTG